MRASENTPVGCVMVSRIYGGCVSVCRISVSCVTVGRTSVGCMSHWAVGRTLGIAALTAVIELIAVGSILNKGLFEPICVGCWSFGVWD